MGKIVVAAIVVTLLIIWGYRFVNERFHIFKKYELFILGLNVLSIWALAKTIQDAISNQPYMAYFDVTINQIMYGLQQTVPVISSIAETVSLIGGTYVIGILGIVICLWFFIKKKWRSGAIMFLSIGSTGFMLILMKDIFLRARPENALHVIVNDPSFPSGHAGMAAAFFLILAYLMAPKIQSWVKREMMIVVCVIVAIMIGLSRIVMNVHWASDVFAGWALGIFMATASILFVRYIGALIVKKS
jgi:undecaprenyl-diphosphatase